MSDEAGAPAQRVRVEDDETPLCKVCGEACLHNPERQIRVHIRCAHEADLRSKHLTMRRPGYAYTRHG